MVLTIVIEASPAPTPAPPKPQPQPQRPPLREVVVKIGPEFVTYWI